MLLYTQIILAANSAAGRNEMKLSEKMKNLTPAQKKNIWENIRMVLILLCMAAPFIFLVIMCISYFVK